jgi:hypothetical protein
MMPQFYQTVLTGQLSPKMFHFLQLVLGVWQRFDQRPQIVPDEANAIVHELIMLLAANHADRALTQLIVRLLPFFSQAYRTQEPILCRSD